MQNLLISRILAPLSLVMGRFSEKQKDRLFVTGGLLIVCLTFLRHSEAVDYRYLYHFTGCCFGMGLMILASLGENLKPIRFRFPFFILLPLFGTLLLISGIINNVNYLPEALMLLLAYPILFLCWNNASRTRIFKLLARVCKISLLIFAAASWLLTPIARTKYSGIFTNENNAAYFLIIACIGILLDIIYSDNSIRRLIPDLLLLGLGTALNFYTNSRTGTYALFLVLFLGGGMFLLKHSKKDALIFFGKMAACLLVSIVFVLSLVYVYQLRQWLPLPYFDGEDDIGFFSATREELLDECFPDWETQLPASGFFDAEGFFHVTNVKTDTTGKDLDAYSTGRVSIWLAFAEDLNLRGHKSVPPKFIPGYNKEFETAHNTCLQFAYESGIPAGITFLIINISSGFATLWFAWKHGKEDYAVAPLMFTAAYGLMSMLGSCSASFGYLATLFYYLSEYCVFARLAEDKQ